ncbi:MAG TPA: hypothetical protein VKU79_01485 [Thermoplasmataceae archaeon]|nr:hypothetical protein [Thermoplasmataceae archaeon]
MSVLDLGRGLDTRGIIAIRQDNKIFSFLKNVKSNLPAYSILWGESGIIKIYLEREHLDDESLSFLEREGVEFSSGSYILTLDMKPGNEFEVLREILSQELLVVNATYVSDGWLLVDFRFSSSRYKEMSKVISKYVVEESNFRLVYLGPSPGIYSILTKLNQSIPLSTVIFEAPAADALNGLGFDPNDVLLMETTNYSVEGGKIRIIVYLSTGGVMTEVREVLVKNGLLEDIRNDANEENISRYNIFMKRHGGNLRIMVFVPSSMLHNYLRILIRRSREYYKEGIYLLASSPFTPDVVESFDAYSGD